MITIKITNVYTVNNVSVVLFTFEMTKKITAFGGVGKVPNISEPAVCKKASILSSKSFFSIYSLLRISHDIAILMF